MAHRDWEYIDKVEKMKYKNEHDCYKLIWQWAKEKTIVLSLFEALCKYVAQNKGVK